MRTKNKGPYLKGSITTREHLRRLKKSDPKTYDSLKNLGPRHCAAWNTITLRGKAELTQAALAAKAGLSRRSIQYLEDITNHYSPSLDVLDKVARALKVEVKDLLNKVDLTKAV